MSVTDQPQSPNTYPNQVGSPTDQERAATLAEANAGQGGESGDQDQPIDPITTPAQVERPHQPGFIRKHGARIAMGLAGIGVGVSASVVFGSESPVPETTPQGQPADAADESATPEQTPETTPATESTPVAETPDTTEATPETVVEQTPGLREGSLDSIDTSRDWAAEGIVTMPVTLLDGSVINVPAQLPNVYETTPEDVTTQFLALLAAYASSVDTNISRDFDHPILIALSDDPEVRADLHAIVDSFRRGNQGIDAAITPSSPEYNSFQSVFMAYKQNPEGNFTMELIHNPDGTTTIWLEEGVLTLTRVAASNGSGSRTTADEWQDPTLPNALVGPQTFGVTPIQGVFTYTLRADKGITEAHLDFRPSDIEDPRQLG